MAYEFEADEWRRATGQMTEAERAATEMERHRSVGMCGDRDDARDEMPVQR